MNNVEKLTTAFAPLVTFGATVWTDLTYSILYKVSWRALKHTGVFETHVVFLTPRTIIGFPLTWSTSHGTAVTHIDLWVTPATMTDIIWCLLISGFIWCMFMHGCVPAFILQLKVGTSLVNGTNFWVLKRCHRYYDPKSLEKFINLKFINYIIFRKKKISTEHKKPKFKKTIK